jgi:hypothetical protein
MDLKRRPWRFAKSAAVVSSVADTIAGYLK